MWKMIIEGTVRNHSNKGLCIQLFERMKNMKKKFIVLALAICCALSNTAQASDVPETVVNAEETKKLYVESIDNKQLVYT